MTCPGIHVLRLLENLPRELLNSRNLTGNLTSWPQNICVLGLPLMAREWPQAGMQDSQQRFWPPWTIQWMPD